MRLGFEAFADFAVRNSDGAYLGTAELTQDLTPLRAPQGERRLLEYDSPRVASQAGFSGCTGL